VYAMDPIEALLRRTAANIGERRVVEALARNALRYVDELRTNSLGLGDHELARNAVERVLAEARAHPPLNALRVSIDKSAPAERVESGVWADDQLALVLRWSNRADFWVELKDLRGTVSLDDYISEETFTLDAPARFEVPPRGERCLALLAYRDRKHPARRYNRSTVSGEAHVEAVVIGPWPDGSHQVRGFSAGRALLPVARALVIQ
jgi:hypothetical protein